MSGHGRAAVSRGFPRGCPPLGGCEGGQAPEFGGQPHVFDPSPDAGAPIAIPLHARDGSIRAYAVIDRADAALAELRWHFVNGYVGRRGPAGRQVYLHRELLGLSSGDGLEVDHINRDRLDNRRTNLRITSRCQNGQNMPLLGGSSKYRGVSWHKQARKWQAYAKLDGKRHYLGLFEDEEEAAQVAAEFRRRHMPFSVDDYGIGAVAPHAWDPSYSDQRRCVVCSQQQRSPIHIKEPA